LDELQSSLKCWETVEYVAVSLVIVGVFGEYLHSFSGWTKRQPWAEKFGKAAALLLILALAVEGVALVKSNSLSGQIISLLDLDRSKLQKQPAWREVGDDQVKILAQHLAGKKIEASFILLNRNDPEEAQFFQSMNSACIKLGIRCVLYAQRSAYPAPFPPPGLLSYAFDDADHSFIDALLAAGLVTGRMGTSIGEMIFPQNIRSGIIIDPKPSPLGSEAWRTNAPPQ
jgi:hypothetical protein